ncbi:MAG: hypothetical protein KBF73_06970 [Flavobacteriales bacterium]|nr:hypothetical protein [Flavobacteriales bacterium]
MKYASEPPQRWQRQDFNETILEHKTVRERSELETNRDLIKPIEQLVCDVHEETHQQDRTELENIACAQKRMVSMMARMSISNERMTKQIMLLTYFIFVLTLFSVIISFLVWYNL